VGKPQLTDLVVAAGFERDEVLARVAAVERGSEHPIAEAIVAAARADGLAVVAAEGFEAEAGYGVRALVDGLRVEVGADRLMRRLGLDVDVFADTAARLADEGKSPLYAAIDGRLAAIIAVADPLKPTSVAAVKALHAMGLKVAMITGDNARTARAIARQAGIDEVIAEVLPDGKVAALQRLAKGGGVEPAAARAASGADGGAGAVGARTRRVAFVGDGINDAPALAEADVGLAIGTGTDVAMESADVVLVSGSLQGVPTAIALSKATIGNIRQNLFWAFAYNTALIPVAAGALYPAFGILLSPIFAAGAMSLSSVFVLGNALRLRRFEAPAVARPTGPDGRGAPQPA
ncbi:MAG TPA: HAD-IC family P-type ATPase, partial [Rhodocyclaceae bacterium]|nr:HAD-IC family P-type ATPase [Rhodocyclaceae bacterium]